MDNAERIPRMRTAAKLAAEIKALDPETEVTEYYIRQLAKSGAVHVVRAGNKTLINLNEVLDLLQQGMPQTEAPSVGGIRRIDAKGLR